MPVWYPVGFDSQPGACFYHLTKLENMKIGEFILNYKKVRYGYECEIFLPHVSEEIPLKRFTTRGIRGVIKSLKDLSGRFKLLEFSDFENETQAAEDLYKELNLIISANY